MGIRKIGTYTHIVLPLFFRPHTQAVLCIFFPIFLVKLWHKHIDPNTLSKKKERIKENLKMPNGTKNKKKIVLL